MSAHGAKKSDLFRVIAERDAEIARLLSETRRLNLLLSDILEGRQEPAEVTP